VASARGYHFLCNGLEHLYCVSLRYKKTAENIIKIGDNLLEVRDVLPHGQFLPWIISEFGMSDQSARNYIHVAERFGGKIKNFLNLSSSVLYSLAAPTTPQSAVDQALELAEEGKKVTHAMAKKLIEAEKARELADKKTFPSLNSTRLNAAIHTKCYTLHKQ